VGIHQIRFALKRDDMKEMILSVKLRCCDPELELEPKQRKNGEKNKKQKKTHEDVRECEITRSDDESERTRTRLTLLSERTACWGMLVRWRGMLPRAFGTHHKSLTVFPAATASAASSSSSGMNSSPPSPNE
jgi:hypothetical protein